MTEASKKPGFLWSLIFLFVAVAVGAHLSAVPLLLVKASVATVLCLVYGYCAYRIVTALQVDSAKLRGVLGLLLGVFTVYATWALRIPAFSGWETPFTADPEAVYVAVLDRSESMVVGKALGGTSSEGPSWLMLGTYIFEALAFVGVMTLISLLSGPAKEKAEESADQPAEMAA